MHARIKLSIVMSTFVIAGLTGCGGGGKTPEQHTVAGLIKLDGQPLKSGTINFTPTDGKKPTSGGTVKDGYYSVQVPPGVMKIAISAPKKVGEHKAYDTPDSPMIADIVEAVPAAYNTSSTLEHTVSASKKDLNFDLKSAP